MSRDMMPSFELYQPDSLEGALKLSKDVEKSWLLAGGQDSYDWFKDRAKRPEALIDITGIAALKGMRETADGLEVGALTTLTEIAENDVVQSKVQPAGARRRARRQPADPQRGHAGRQSLPGRALLVLPRRRRLLPRRRQHLLRRHAAGPEPRALPVRRRALHRGDAIGRGAGGGGARGCHRHRGRRGRARGAGRGILHRSGGGHHAHDHPQAR